MKGKILALAAVIAVLTILNAHFPFRGHLETGVEWFRGLGPWAVAPYAVLFVLCALFFIPVSGMILMAGTLYGFLLGYLLAAASGMLAVAVTYALGKKLWRERVEVLRRKNPRYEAIFDAVSERGPILVFLIRLNPFLPFALLNYLFTIPRLDFRKYLLSSFLGMTPDIFFYLYAGHVGKGLLENPDGVDFWSFLILGASLMATLIVAILINRIIREASARASASAPPATVPSGAGLLPPEP
jgi:uncharacterized membrane protein YdjX (TVP38/TMEM64 family)